MAATRGFEQVIIHFAGGAGNYISAKTRVTTVDSDNPQINFRIRDNFDVTQTDMTAQEVADVSAAIQTIKAVLEAHRPIV